MVLADAWNAWDDQPAKNNTRAKCAETMDTYRSLDPWFGIEQEYTLMKPGKVGVKPSVPLGFNVDGSEPAPQGPYYTGAGYNVAIGRPVADEHYKLCVEAGVKISGINAEVMPGQWEFQIGPCRGIEMGDHLTMARYIMLRVTEKHECICSFDPKPAEGDWNGAGCHTNFSVTPMRVAGGYDTIIKVCEAFGKVAKEHIAEYGEGNDKRLTGKHETCDINTFKYLARELHIFSHLAHKQLAHHVKALVDANRTGPTEVLILPLWGRGRSALSGTVWPTAAHPSASLAMLRRAAVVTWRTAAQRPTATHTE